MPRWFSWTNLAWKPASLPSAFRVLELWSLIRLLRIPLESVFIVVIFLLGAQTDRGGTYFLELLFSIPILLGLIHKRSWAWWSSLLINGFKVLTQIKVVGSEETAIKFLKLPGLEQVPFAGQVTQTVIWGMIISNLLWIGVLYFSREKFAITLPRNLDFLRKRTWNNLGFELGEFFEKERQAGVFSFQAFEEIVKNSKLLTKWLPRYVQLGLFGEALLSVIQVWAFLIYALLSLGRVTAYNPNPFVLTSFLGMSITVILMVIRLYFLREFRKPNLRIWVLFLIFSLVTSVGNSVRTLHVLRQQPDIEIQSEQTSFQASEKKTEKFSTQSYLAGGVNQLVYSGYIFFLGTYFLRGKRTKVLGKTPIDQYNHSSVRTSYGKNQAQDPQNRSEAIQDHRDGQSFASPPEHAPSSTQEIEASATSIRDSSRSEGQVGQENQTDAWPGLR